MSRAAFIESYAVAGSDFLSGQFRHVQRVKCLLNIFRALNETVESVVAEFRDVG